MSTASTASPRPRARLLDEASAQGLPPKPEAPPGRAVLWVYVLGEPGFVYKGAQHLVDEAWVDGLLARHQILTRRGYTVPLVAQHPAALHDTDAIKELIDLAQGLRAGDVLQLAKARVEGKLAVLAAVCPAMPAADVARAVELGQIKYFSPGLGPVETDEGDVLYFALKELSLVTAPHQKTAASHVLAAEQEVAAMEPENDKELTPDERLVALEAMVAELSKAIAAMGEKMTAMEPEATDDEEADEDEPVTMSESPEVEALRMQVTALQRDNFAARFPVGATVQLTEADVDLFFGRKGSQDFLARAKATAAVRLSQIGGERHEAATPTTPEELRAACLAECKGDQDAATRLYLTRRKAQLAGGLT